MPDRIVVFIDAQNTYRQARRAFFRGSTYHVDGQFNPVALASYITSNGPAGSNRVLHQVRIYTGRPDSTKQPKSHAPHMKQCAAWEAAGAKVIYRMLRYPRNWPIEREEEKGIDVALAIDFVAMAIDREYDIGVMVSADTDLIPALELVIRKHSPKTVEVASWGGLERRRLRVPGQNVWCHWLDQTIYNAVADTTDYSRP